MALQPAGGRPDDAVSAIDAETGPRGHRARNPDAPLAGARALALFSESGIRADVMNDLVNCDAIRFTGSVMEVQHEAMADYLRAREVAAAQEDTTLVRLATLPLAAFVLSGSAHGALAD